MKNIIGNILQELLGKKGAPSKRDFAEMLGMSPKTLYNVIDGSSELTLTQIIKASEILNYNIVSEYHMRLPANSQFLLIGEGKEEKSKETGVTVTMNFGVMQRAYSNIGDFMKEIHSIATKHGITVL